MASQSAQHQSRFSITHSPMTVPPNVLAASPIVGMDRQSLPLNVLTLIISHVDDLGDIARLTRTSRLLYYLTLPKLWENVTLRSYAELRYIDGRPEGFGGGSPFAMGLASLVGGDHSSYVKYLRLVGEFREPDVDEYSKGRVPDNAMMMNIALRAAIDRLPRLETFKWELNTKMSQIVYQGLALRPLLSSLIIKFPSERTPRPTALIPPMPQLRTLVCLEMDPLAYPDDISLLLLGSKKLESLTLHWNPRIRRNAEQCISFGSYFQKCLAAGYALKLKHFGLYNLYAAHTDIEQVFDPERLESIYTMNLGGTNAHTIFLDDTWIRNKPKMIPPRLKIVRMDIIDRDRIHLFTISTRLEEIYLLGNGGCSPNPTSEASPSLANGARPDTAEGSPATPSTEINTPQSQRPDRHECVSLASDYLVAIQHHHGASLRCLLLPDYWLLDAQVIKKLVIACPNIEQLGLAVSDPHPEQLSIFFAYAPNIFAFRSMNKPTREMTERLSSVDERIPALLVGQGMWRPEFKNLKYFDLGQHMMYQCGPVVPDPRGKGGLIRLVKKISVDTVKHINIWAMDTREVI